MLNSITDINTPLPGIIVIFFPDSNQIGVLKLLTESVLVDNVKVLLVVHGELQFEDWVS